MDNITYYFLEAVEFANDYKYISLADSFFEETEEDKETNKENEGAVERAISSVKKALDALVEMIRNTINRIVDFFKTKLLSKDEAERYKAFKAKVRSNPELKNIRVTVKDFRLYEQAFDEAIKALETENAKEEIDPTKCEQIMDKLDKTVNTLKEEAAKFVNSKVIPAGKRAIMTVALDTAIDMADRNATIAKGIQKALDEELIDIDQLSKQAGETNAVMFQNKIQKISKNGIFHRFKVKVLRKKEATLEAVMKHQVDRIMSFTNFKDGDLPAGKLPVDAKSLASGALQNPDMVAKTLGGSDSKDSLASDAANAAKTARKIKKEYKKTVAGIKDLGTFFGFDK